MLDRCQLQDRRLLVERLPIPALRTQDVRILVGLAVSCRGRHHRMRDRSECVGLIMICACGKAAMDGKRCALGASHRTLEMSRVANETKPVADEPVVRERLPIKRERL